MALGQSTHFSSASPSFSDQGSFLVTDDQETIVYASQGLEGRLGFSPHEAMGNRPGNLWGGSMDDSFYRTMRQTVKKEKRPFVASVENRKKSGDVVFESIHVAPILDKDATVRYFVEVHPNPAFRMHKQFEQEFVSFFSNQAQTYADFLPWMSRWVSLDVSHFSVRARALPEYIRAVFVEPAQARYLPRYDDAALIESAQEDPELFGALYTKYKDRIRQYFLSRVSHDPQSADDLTQETFARAFRYMPSFRIRNATYLTYLLRIAHNLLVNYYRKTATMSQEKQRLDLSDSEPAIDGWAGAIAAEVWDLLGVLSDVEQYVILMKYRDGLKVAEIAALLDKSENAVKLHLGRARKKLSEAIGVF